MEVEKKQGRMERRRNNLEMLRWQCSKKQRREKRMRERRRERRE